ncbi:formin-like protein 3 isoform X1 [Iris pallida]|uniref:Formin-like protein 3 isoform X1 n=1 Tax=Iris pallida TaxID=29817 RepID=A0AAX6E605_IRIPA|nr:formin-like protein 3 isoform X1 [Iris pallida]
MASSSSSKRSKTHHNNKKPKPTPSPNPSREQETTTTASTRKSERKRKVLFTVAAAAAASSASSQHHWTEEESLSLLRHLVAFKSDNGAAPTPTQAVGPFFDSIKHSLPADVTPKILLNKVNLLRRRYKKYPSSPDTPLHRLSAQVWGTPTDTTNPNPNPNPSPTPTPTPTPATPIPTRLSSFPYLFHAAKGCLADIGFPVEAAGAEVDAARAAELEGRWKEFAMEEMRLRMERLDLERQLCSLVLDTAAKG